MGVTHRDESTDDEAVREQVSRAVEMFAGRFGREPRFAAFAPGRVNLIGEHTDYNDGFVLPIAINRRTVIVAGLATSDHSTMWAADLGQTFTATLTKPLSPLMGTPGSPGSPANYLLGVVHQFAERGHRVPELDLLVTSTVPVGAGLSSSASVEVAMATLLEQVVQAPLEPLEKALLCQRAEHTFPRVPCGVMDMLITAMATAHHALFIDCRSLRAQPVRWLPRKDFALIIVDTGVKHSLAAGEYAQRRAVCESAAGKLGVASLRDATLPMLQRDELTAEERRRALHVISENTRTVLAAAALGSGDVRTFGELLFAGHDSLRDVYEVSCPELDAVVEAARALRAEGVCGARMTGGGFGGCAMVLCAAPAADGVMRQLRSAFAARFGRAPDMFTTGAAGAAQTLALSQGRAANGL